MEMPGYFEKNIVFAAGNCGQTAELSAARGIYALSGHRLGARRVYRASATTAMAARGQFWLTLHTRVDFFGSARMSQEVTAATWPEPCSHHALRCYRSYSLRRGDELLALGRTQWAVLEPKGRLLPLVRDVFPADYAYCGRTGITDAPTRFHDDFTPADEVFTHTVRSTDIDAGHHMNNVAYVRVLLDCFPAAVLAGRGYLLHRGTLRGGLPRGRGAHGLQKGRGKPLPSGHQKARRHCRRPRLRPLQNQRIKNQRRRRLLRRDGG